MKLLLKCFVLFCFVLVLQGCPVEENQLYCSKVMHCEEDREMLCDKTDSGCGQDCNYFVYEHCYEVCETDAGID